MVYYDKSNNTACYLIYLTTLELLQLQTIYPSLHVLPYVSYLKLDSSILQYVDSFHSAEEDSEQKTSPRMTMSIQFDKSFNRGDSTVNMFNRMKEILGRISSETVLRIVFEVESYMTTVSSHHRQNFKWYNMLLENFMVKSSIIENSYQADAFSSFDNSTRSLATGSLNCQEFLKDPIVHIRYDQNISSHLDIDNIQLLSNDCFVVLLYELLVTFPNILNIYVVPISKVSISFQLIVSLTPVSFMQNYNNHLLILGLE